MTFPRLGKGCNADDGAGLFMLNGETSVGIEAYKLRIVIDNVCNVERIKDSTAKLVEIPNSFSAVNRS